MSDTDSFESQGIKLLRSLYKEGKRILTTADLKQAATEININSTKINKIVSNLSKRGHLLRLRRGLYAIKEALSGEANIHSFAISNYLISPSAISHWSALQHHGLTEQVPYIISASTTKKIVTPSMRGRNPSPSQSKNTWAIEGLEYEYYKIAKSHWFGIEKIWVGEYQSILITDKERTLIDCFAFSKLFGGIGEAIGMLENALPTININKLISYAIKFDNKAVIKRLGWSLENLNINKKTLKPLLEIPIHYYCRLDPSEPAKGSCEKPWMIQNNLKE